MDPLVLGGVEGRLLGDGAGRVLAERRRGEQDEDRLAALQNAVRAWLNAAGAAEPRPVLFVPFERRDAGSS